jgi:hypothetical protein
MRSLAVLALAPVILLSGCATPREACIGSAQSQLRTINALIAETRGNLERGYGLEEVQEVVTIPARCEGTASDGTTFRYDCPRTQTRTRTEPVAIDLNAERRTLESLLERQAQQERATQAAVQQCIAIHPE